MDMLSQNKGLTRSPWIRDRQGATRGLSLLLIGPLWPQAIPGRNLEQPATRHRMEFTGHSDHGAELRHIPLQVVWAFVCWLLGSCTAYRESA